MEHILEFITNHLALSLIFVTLLAYILFTELQGPSGSRLLDPHQVVTSINREAAVVIDTRPKDAFISGHIINSINMSAQDIEKSEQYKNKNVILVCDNGQKTPVLSAKLKKIGFDNIATLKGGMSAWKQADLPSES